MHTLIVVAHPEGHSLSHGIAEQIAVSVREGSPDGSVEIADIASESFDPRFTTADLAVHRSQAVPPSDVMREQSRIDRADTLVLVYPVYWWSMPALLKGWIDRVFSNGWAFDFQLNGKLTKKLGHLRVHLVAIAGGDVRTFARHGYFGAMKTQIDHGIFDYCGATVVSSDILFDSETRDPALHLDEARSIGRKIVEAAEVQRSAA